MNTKLISPLVLAVLMVVVGAQSPTGNPSRIEVPACTRIVELPTLRVYPAVEDAAYHQAHKIVDLATVTVSPSAADQAFFLAGIALRGSLACRC